MTLSPFEVERREFSKAPFGYKAHDVDQFVDEVHRSLQQLWEERADVREENERIKERLARFEQMESQLTSTLLLAQDSAEKSHEQARRESDLVMREAGQKARDIIHAAHEDKQRLEMVLRDLHSAEQEARQRLRALSGAIISHLDDTEQLVADGAATFRAVVQAHPEATELRASNTQELRAADIAAAAERLERTEEAVDPTRATGAPAELRRTTAKGEVADAFFDAPPTFDATQKSSRPGDAAKVIETADEPTFADY
ncbi:MAG: DivIVA domain-containing protein [Thermoleophilia bacterium]|nr:DivIVA domain-containing protein [Thermoleophilia bacterium]